MRVIFVNKFATITGGADRYALDLAALLIERGHSVRMLAFRPAGTPPMSGRYMVPTVTGDSKAGIGPAAAARVAATMVWNPHAANGLRRLIEEERPDVIHFHKIFPQLSVAPIAVAAKAGLPIVQRAADFEFISARPEDPSGAWVDRGSGSFVERTANTISFAARRLVHVPRVSRWLVATDFMRDVYAEHGIAAEAIPHFLSPPAAPIKSFAERQGVAFLGRLTETKGIRDVVALAGSRPGIPVVVAGTGPLGGWVSERADQLPNLAAPGHLDRAAIDELLASVRVVVIPSLWPEPAGQVALEAMNRGTPVVAYACGGLTDYVRSNGGGILVPQGDTAALIEAATALHRDGGDWNELSLAGIEGIAANHDPQTHAERVEAVYEEASA